MAFSLIRPGVTRERAELDIAKQGIAILEINYQLAEVVISVMSKEDRGCGKVFSMPDDVQRTRIVSFFMNNNQWDEERSETVDGSSCDVAPRYLAEVRQYVGLDVKVDTLKVEMADTIPADNELRQHKDRFLGNVPLFLNTGGSPLKFHTFDITYSGDCSDDASVKKFLEGGAEVSELCFRPLQINVHKELWLKSIVELEQWKNAEKLKIHTPFYLTIRSSQWQHFNRSEVILYQLDWGTVREIIAWARGKPSFPHCIIETVVGPDKSAICAHFDPVTTNFYTHESGVNVTINDRIFTFTRPLPVVPHEVRDEWECEENIELSSDHARVRRVRHRRDFSVKFREVKYDPVETEENEREKCYKEVRDGECYDVQNAEKSKPIELNYIAGMIKEGDAALEKCVALLRFRKIGVVIGRAERDDDENNFNDGKTLLLEHLENVQDTGKMPVRVKQFHMKYSGNAEDEELILGYLRNTQPTELHFQCQRPFRNESKKLVLDEILKSSQWKEAKKITMCWPLWTTLSPDHWCHCDKTQLVLKDLSVETFKKIIANANTRCRFVYCAIEIRDRKHTDELFTHITRKFRWVSQHWFQNANFDITVMDMFYLIKKRQ